MYQRNYQIQPQSYAPSTQTNYSQFPPNNQFQQGFLGNSPAQNISTKQQAVPFQDKLGIQQRSPYQQQQISVGAQFHQQQLQYTPSPPPFSVTQGNQQIQTQNAGGFLQQSNSTSYTQSTSTQNTLGNSRVISVERRLDEVDTTLQCENERLQKQYAQLENLLEVFQQFEINKNLNELKTFNSINQQKFGDLIDEIYDFKAKLEEEKRKGDELRQLSVELKQGSIQSETMSQGVSGPLLSLQNQELQKQLDQLKEQQNKLKSQISQLDQKKNQQEYYVDTKEQLDQQIQNQEETEKQLQSEVNLLISSNQKLAEQLNKKDFFKEYDFMVREKKGLQEQNEKVEKEIKIRDDELYKLKGKQEAPFPQCGMAPLPRS